MKADEFLKGKYSDGNLFFLWGTEPFLLHASIRALTDARAGEPAELNYARLPRSSKPGEIIAACEQLPSFADCRVVLVENSELFDKGDAAALTGYLPSLPQTTVAAFTYSGAPDKRRALYKYMAKNAVCVEAAPLAAAGLCRWMISQARRSGITLSPECARQLMEISGTDMYVLQGEIRKLAMCGEAITPQIVAQLASKSTEYNIFLLHGMMLEGNYAGAFALAGEIRAGERSFIPLLSLLSSKFLPMYMAKSCLNAGYSDTQAAETIAARAKLHPFAAKMAVRECKKLRLGDIKDAVRRIGDYEYALKTGGNDPGIECMLMHIYAALER